jgi:hypothetical protein
MTVASKRTKIDEIMERASESLSHMRYFEAERLAAKALAMAREDRDYERMTRIIMPLLEARRQRGQQALEVGRVVEVDAPITDDMKVLPGCHLVQPPQVGADARRLRMLALQHEVPAVVLCREPKTRLGQWPIVALGAGATVRVKVQPPARSRKPDIEWFVETMRELGDSAIESLDPALEPDRRVDALLARLDAVPEHEDLHQALQEACRDAAQAAASSSRAASAPKAPARLHPEPADDDE